MPWEIRAQVTIGPFETDVFAAYVRDKLLDWCGGWPHEVGARVVEVEAEKPGSTPGR